MARRTREADLAEFAAQAMGLLILFLFLFSRRVHELFFGNICDWFLVLVFCATAGVLLGLLLYRVRSAKQMTDSVPAAGSTLTPTLGAIRSGLQSQPLTPNALLRELESADWFKFEKVIGAVYAKLGYIVRRRGGANPDGGIDLIIEKGDERLAIQCKHWKSRDVGVAETREFLGALTDSGLQNGLLITLSGFTAEAKELAERNAIQLINETALGKLLESADAVSDATITSILRDRRKFCPKCESEMVLRTARKGFRVGTTFWGCSNYPKCHQTMPS